MPMELDFDRCYRAIRSRDARFDGQFFSAVTTTGIYCRPICHARTPRPGNVRFFACAAAAEAAGFRACRRCRPETSPGSPDWDTRADLAARALRLIARGYVDSAGVGGLARRLAVSPRHLHRELVAEVGTGPLSLARTRRAQTARLLIDQTALPLTTVAFAAGFDSLRQFNETMHASFGRTPTELRRRQAPPLPGGGEVALRLRYRPPLPFAPLLAFLGGRAIPGVEEVWNTGYRRTLAASRSRGTLALEFESNQPCVTLRLGFESLADLPWLVQCCRQLLDLDADPAAIAYSLGADALLGPLVAAWPGLRIPGTVDGFELAVRLILGQQVSVAGARVLAMRLVARLGSPLAQPIGSLTHYFPSAAVLAEADLVGLGLTQARIRGVRALAQAVVSGRLTLDRGADRAETLARLRELPGIGPWTASSIALRALADPDAFPASDLGLARALRALGHVPTGPLASALTDGWRPWRGYAAFYLWQSLAQPMKGSE